MGTLRGGVFFLSLPKDMSDYLGDKYVLVIEPAQNYRTSLKNFLYNLRVKQVRFVQNVAEARREMLAIKVGLFIVEWQLQDKNGLQFCRELRRDKPFRNTPFLLLSTENFKKDVMLASEGGINGYLLKPFSYEDFCGQLSSLISAARQPSNLNSLLDEADSLLEENKISLAETLYRQATIERPTSARASVGLAKVYLAQGDRDIAMSYFSKAVEYNPEYIEAYRCMLNLAESARNMATCLQLATILHRLSPDNPRYPLVVAKCYMDGGNLDESERYFKVSVRLSPKLAEGYKGLGHVYFQKRDYEKAMRNFLKALDLEQADVPTLNSLALSYVKQGMIEEAIRRYKMALSIDPHDARIHFNIGLAYEQANHRELAREYYKKALSIEPSMKKAKNAVDRIVKGQDFTPSPDDAFKLDVA
jgi:tetratricopeptide (TPR) repeat protein